MPSQQQASWINSSYACRKNIDQFTSWYKLESLMDRELPPRGFCKVGRSTNGMLLLGEFGTCQHARQFHLAHLLQESLFVSVT